MTDASATLPYFTAADVARLLTLERAMDALESALRGGAGSDTGLDPEADGPRLFSPAPRGEFLLLPAQGPAFSGLKALTVAPDNPARGLEKIQGVYILYSSETLAPVALMEGSSLTAIRTPAVTVSTIRQLAAIAPEDAAVPADPRILVFGAGIQALSHIRACALAFPSAHFGVIGRRPERVAALREALRNAPETAESVVDDLGGDTAAVGAAVSAADIIVCATSTSTPLFDGALVRDGAIVAAVGTHGLEMREIDDTLVRRADLVVEGRGSAQRENGNLTALTAADWTGGHRPVNLRELALGRMRRRSGAPVLYTGVGMAWEDLVCATTVYTASDAVTSATPAAADPEEPA